MKILYLITILLAALNCRAKVDVDFTVIFASGTRVLIGKSKRLFETRELANFEDKVTALAVNRDHLFVISGSDIPWPNSILRRYKVIRSENGEITGLDKDIRSELEWNFDKKISTFVVVQGNIHFDGDTVICPASNCSNYRGFDLNLTGIDYNPADNHLYASTKYGDLKLWHGLEKTNEYKSIFKSFNIVSFWFEKASALKVAFGKVWIGFYNKNNKAELWKCSFNYIDENLSFIEKNCESFQQYNTSLGKIVRIDATHNYLYVNLKKSAKVSCCDPNQNGSCVDDFRKPRGFSGPFVIDTMDK